MAPTRIVCSSTPLNAATDVIASARGKIAQTGSAHVFAGSQVEHPETVQLIIEANEANASISEALQTGLPDATIMDVEFEQPADLAESLAAPVTEVVSFYFGDKIPGNYSETVAEFRELMKTIDGCVNTSNGWVSNEVEYQGLRGKASVLTLGWTSIDAHMRFRDMPIFKEKIHLARNGAEKVEMHHVVFQQV